MPRTHHFIKYAIILVAQWCTQVCAQELTVLSSAIYWSPLASDPKGEFDTLNIPLIRVDKLVMLQAEVDGVSGNFIFDTGAPGLILNSAYFRDQKNGTGISSQGVAGQGISGQARIKKLSIGELFYENMLVDLTELGHIENKKNVKIIGLLGMALFEKLEWSIDIKNSRLQIVRPNKKQAELLQKPDLALQIQYLNHAIFVPVKLDGKKLTFCFDTGAEVLVLDNQLPASVMKNLSINKRMSLSGTGGQRIDVFAGDLKNLSIKDLNIPNTVALVTGLQNLSEVYGFPLDGIIGFDLLNMGVVKVDLSTRKLLLYLYEVENDEELE